MGVVSREHRGFLELTCASATDEAAPPPSVILDCQLEVGERDSDERGHDKQNDEYDEEDAVDGVHLVPPHAGKNVVPAWQTL